MEMITWTDEGWQGMWRLCDQMAHDGLTLLAFPSKGMERIDTLLYADCDCRCRNKMHLFPFCDESRKMYRVFTVCPMCGRTVRKGCGDGN